MKKLNHQNNLKETSYLLSSKKIKDRPFESIGQLNSDIAIKLAIESKLVSAESLLVLQEFEELE